MDVVTYTGNGGTQSIDGMSFSPDLIIIKNINSGGTTALWQDTIRGTTKYLRSASSTGETTTSFNVDSFDPDGFTVTGNIDMTNQNGEDYVAWCWNCRYWITSPQHRRNHPKYSQVKSNYWFLYCFIHRKRKDNFIVWSWSWG